MSSVTSVILIVSILDDENSETVKIFNDKLFKLCGHSLLKCSQKSGGSKIFGANIYIGGINYLDFRGLIAIFKSIYWEMPKTACLMLMDEDETKFKAYYPDKKTVYTNVNNIS